MYYKTVTKIKFEASVAKKLKQLLKKHSHVFARNEGDFGRTNIVLYEILTCDHVPIHVAPRRLPLAQQNECEKEISSMLEKGVIEPGSSPWALPVV